MRKVTLDLETTGLNPLDGHKIIEIGCVELMNNFPTGNTWQTYINPKRNIPQEAFEIHGLTEEFLENKPFFKDTIDDFLNFIKDSDLIIHNAKFDMKFINYELEANNLNPISNNKVIDTIDVAKKIFPGQSNSLDALCKRYKINLEKRKFHGALLDAELLAEVYLEMQGGRQQGFELKSEYKDLEEKIDIKNIQYSKKVYKLTKEEIENNYKLMKSINNY
ncbi:DNA polymerase III subunit epsilon [Alphaproteobacteria bacterium]|nr:DNA polymerase III subunit epsilon [Alphaproteobacteria bacterium]